MKLTHCIVIESGIDAVLDMIRELDVRKSFTFSRGTETDMSELVSNVHLTSGWHARRAILWQPQNREYCIFISDDSSNMFHQFYCFNNCYHTRFFGFNVYTPEHGWEPGIQFFHYRSSGDQRYISIIREGKKWIFYETGDILSFENPEKYTLRRKKDRLTTEMIYSYMLALDCNIESTDLYMASQYYCIENMDF